MTLAYADQPELYGLPRNPTIPLAVRLWFAWPSLRRRARIGARTLARLVDLLRVIPLERRSVLLVLVAPAAFTVTIAAGKRSGAEMGRLKDELVHQRIEELDAEKKVVFEEMNLTEDDPGGKLYRFSPDA